MNLGRILGFECWIPALFIDLRRSLVRLHGVVDDMTLRYVVWILLFCVETGILSTT